MTQQADRQTANTEIAEFFDRVAASGVQPRLRSVTGTCRFDVADAGNWLVTVEAGRPTVEHDVAATSPADCVVTIGAEDLVHLIRGESNLNMFAALLQGLVTVSGDVGLVTTLLGSYVLEPVGSQSRP